MPASGIPSELSAHQIAPAGAIAHSRPHLCPRASSLSFSSLVSPLRPLGLGLLGRCDPRAFICFYVVTDAGPASHRVRLWQGGPASTYCRFRHPLFLFTGTCFLGVRLLALPEVRKGPWPLQRPRGDGNGGRFVRSPCLPSWCGLRLLHAVPFWSLCSDGPMSSRPQPLGRGGDVAPCEDTREDLGLSI